MQPARGPRVAALCARSISTCPREVARRAMRVRAARAAVRARVRAFNERRARRIMRVSAGGAPDLLAAGLYRTLYIFTEMILRYFSRRADAVASGSC